MKGGQNSKEELRKYLLFGIIFLLFFFSFKIVQPYLIVIISAFILSYLALPLFNKLNKKLNKSVSAAICIFAVFLAVILPLGAVVGGVISQAYGLINNGEVIGFIKGLESSSLVEEFNIDMAKLFESGALLVVSLLSSALSYLPSLIISLIVLVFGMYYILADYDELAKELKNYLPFEDKNKIAQEIDKSTKGIIYGSFLIAIIEFIVGAAGFYISGVDSYLLLPLLIFFFAFIPGLGPTIVWLPLAIYYLITGNVFALVGVTITGLVLSFYIDTILRTKILGTKSNINPFIMLIGILGGISFFGIFGFVIGPLILIYSLKILRAYFSK